MALNLEMNVLIVDDYTSMLRAVRRVFNALGLMNVDTANTVEEAMRHLTSGQKTYGLIISDYNMEPADGLDLLRQVRSTPLLAKVPFIMMSADDDPALPQRFKEAGATDFMRKPFGIAALENRLKQIFSD